MVSIFRRKKNDKIDENDEATLKSKYKLKAAGFRTDAASVFKANLSTCRSGVAAMLDVELRRANSLSSITVDDSITSSIGLEISEPLCHADENDECEDGLQSSASCLYTTPYHACLHRAPTQRDPAKGKQNQNKLNPRSPRQRVSNRGLNEFLTSNTTRHPRSKGSSSRRSCVSMPGSVNSSKRRLRNDTDDYILAYEKIVSDKGVERECLFEPTGWE
jgi:hypothetical protein